MRKVKRYFILTENEVREVRALCFFGITRSPSSIIRKSGDIKLEFPFYTRADLYTNLGGQDPKEFSELVKNPCSENLLIYMKSKQSLSYVFETVEGEHIAVNLVEDLWEDDWNE